MYSSGILLDSIEMWKNLWKWKRSITWNFNIITSQILSIIVTTRFRPRRLILINKTYLIYSRIFFFHYQLLNDWLIIQSYEYLLLPTFVYHQKSRHCVNKKNIFWMFYLIVFQYLISMSIKISKIYPLICLIPWTIVFSVCGELLHFL